MLFFFLMLSLFQYLKIHRCEVPSSWEVLFWELEVGVGRVKHYSAKEQGWASVTFYKVLIARLAMRAISEHSIKIALKQNNF